MTRIFPSILWMQRPGGSTELMGNKYSWITSRLILVWAYGMIVLLEDTILPRRAMESIRGRACKHVFAPY